MLNNLKAISVMVGYTIGVGMFSLPFLVAKAGILDFLFLLVIFATIQYFQQLVFAKLLISNYGFHRLPGYADRYFGKKSRAIALFAQLFGSYGALLAYIVITGIFLNQLFSPVFGEHEVLFGSIAFFVQAFVVFFGVRMLASVELTMSGLLLLTIAFICWKAGKSFEVSALPLVDWKYFLFPYGAILFALDGSGSVPIVVKLLGKKEKKVKTILKANIAICALFTAIFAIVVAGVTGSGTTTDALSGLREALGDGILVIGLICGIFAMVTSFLGSAEALKEMFVWDYKVKPNLALVLTLLVPYLLYIFGLNNLIGIVSFAGAVSGGISAILLLLIYMEMKRKERIFIFFHKKPRRIIIFPLIVVFIVGIFYEIVHFLNN